jgi:dTDP-4-dehydrorhamnose 3,5-epimerase
MDRAKLREAQLKVTETELAGVLIIEPDVYQDARGFFLETYHQNRYRDLGIQAEFVQDNMSLSKKGTLRGLHFQHPHAQAKLVQVAKGTVFDVVVDIRRGSPTFGKWTAKYLSDDKSRQIFVPEGFAHGFCVMSEYAVFIYKCSEFYARECEGGILWSDPGLDIRWPVENPLVSEKDMQLPRLKDLATDRLPVYR